MPAKKEEPVKESSPPDFHPFMPGIEDIVMDILHKEAVKTLKEYDTDKETMFYYTKPILNLGGDVTNPKIAGIYKRDEPELKKIADQNFLKKLKEMSDLCDKIILEDPTNEKILNLQYKIQRKMNHDGIKNSEITEILQSIRRKTFTDREEINTGGFIPLKNGLYNIKTHELREFNPSYFYTWKVEGTFDPAIKSINQIPMFKDFLTDVFDLQDIPLILDYLAYCLFPDFPRQKILVIPGEERRGKGTLLRLVERMIPEGYGRITLMKLLMPDNRFSLQSIEGKNVLIDSEIKRNSNMQLDFSTINSLFGGDTLPLEKKFKPEINYRSKSKGILIGNIPLFYVDDSAFLSRLVIVVPKPKPKRWREIPDLDKKIWDSEGSDIVAFLLNRLRGLIKRNFRFANELTYGQYAEIWNNLCNSPKMFAEQEMEISHENVSVETAYDLYVAWCGTKNIPPEKEKTFSNKVGKVYPIKRPRINGKPTSVFSDCSLSCLVMDVQMSKPQTKDNDEQLDDFL
ncbi:MAG: DUF5906 domain-containing protein [Cuniculiplasma sp.]